MTRVRRFGARQTARCIAVFLALFSAVAVTPTGLVIFLVHKDPVVLVFSLCAPVLYGITGWLGTVISCWLYNLVAGWVGGIEIETEEE